MNDGILPPMGVCMVTLCRILKPSNWMTAGEFEPVEGGAISSMKVAVPNAVLGETAASGDMETLDKWVEDEFGFPWVLSHASEMQFITTEQYHEWSTQL